MRHAGPADAVLEALAGCDDELPQLTASLVRCRSENPPGDERAVVAAVRDAVQDIEGIELRVVEPAPRRASLIAAVGPPGTRTLLLGAHVDTVPAGGGWRRPPFAGEIDGDAVHGRGTSDNKGAVAAMVVALRALATIGVTSQRRVIFVANADEEAGGGLGMDHVRDVLGEPVDGAVVAEPSGIDAPFERLWIAARGALRFSLRATGTATHTSLAGRDGVANAADALLAAIAALRARTGLLRQAHDLCGHRAELIVVRLEGGSGWGVVPPEARADIELRVAPGVTRAAAEDAVAAALAGLDVEVVPAPHSLGWVEPSAVEPDSPLVRSAAAAWHAVLGEAPQLGCFPGGTDARSLSERGIPTVPGVGPGTLARAHTREEHVGIGELATAARLYALTAVAFLLEDANDNGRRHGAPD